MSYLILVAALAIFMLGRYLVQFAKRGRWIKRVSIGLFVGFSWLLSACLVLFFLLGHLMGAVLRIPTASSPGNKVSSRIWVDWGPATEPFYSSVELRSTHFELSPSGVKSRLFFHSVYYGEEDPRDIQVEWNGEHELKIRYARYPNRPSDFTCDSVWRDVKITCESYTSDPNKSFQPLPPPDFIFW
jgi:hypothetical protein